MQQDIIIVGGGPAGLSTALHLIQLAPELTPRILILEKGHYPRPKLCAGAMSLDAEIILEQLDLDVREVPHVDATEAHLDFAGKGMKFTLPGTHALRIIQRDEFDAWLARKTQGRGVEIKEGVKVTSVRLGPNSAIVETDIGMFEASVVVGADGSTGVTRRSVLPKAPVHTARVLEVLTPVLPEAGRTDTASPAIPPPIVKERARPAPSYDRHSPDIAYSDFFPVPRGIGGYTWDFPTQVGGQLIRCWGVYDSNVLAGHERPPLRDPLAEEMKRHGYDLKDYRLLGHPILWFNPWSQFSVPRVILAGDAAGADGIFGGGISMALGYGEVAAKALRDAFARNDFSFNDYRRRILRSPLGRALTLRTGFTYVLYSLRWEWFQKFFWRSLNPIVLYVATRLVFDWARRTKSRVRGNLVVES